MAYYRKLPSGKHNYVVRMPNGKRKSFTDSLKGVAKKRAEDFERALRDGGPVTIDRRLTVRQWHDKWITTRNVEPTTARKERSALAVHILPRWGDWPLVSIARSDVQAWITELTRSGLAGSYIGVIYRTFGKLLGDAVEDEKLTATPCRKIELPRESRPVPRWLTRHEYDRLQMALAGDVDRPDPHAAVWRAMVAVGAFCGLRPGELAGLDVGWIDFDRQLIRVEQVMTPHGLRDYPKTDASRRSVPFPDEVGELLWRAVADRATDDAAFPARAGGRLYFSNWAVAVWQPALKRAGIRYVRPYVLRHTAASWLIQSGKASKEDIAAVLGHGGTRLVNLYAHLAPDAHDNVRAAWAKARDPRAPHTAGQGAGLDGISAGQEP